MKRGHHQIEIAAATEVAMIDGAPARRVKLLPIGLITMRDGRGPFLIRDRAHAEQIVAATRQWLGDADFNFDYDHQVAFAAKPGVGGTAVAAGWVKPTDITVQDDGIYADVAWTAAAAQKLAAREYRYLSPLFLAAKSGEVLQLKNAALVNIGAIDLPAIAAGLSGEEDDMSFALIAAALGLAATATEQEIVAAATDLKAQKATPATSAIAIAAGLAEAASVEEIAASVTALKAAKPDPAKFVPIEQVSAITAQLGTLNAERAEREVAAAMAVGKLAPAMKDWGLSLFKSDEKAWGDYLDSAPVIVAAGAELGSAKPAAKATTLTADEIAACEMTGTSHEDFLKAKNEGIA
jgi:phage I-like protein